MTDTSAAPGDTGHIEIDAMRLVSAAHRALANIDRRLMREALRRDHDLSGAQMRILAAIGEETVPIKALDRDDLYVGSSCFYNVAKLVRDGYLLEEASKKDRRSRVVRASPKGLALSVVARLVIAQSAAIRRQDLAAVADAHP